MSKPEEAVAEVGDAGENSVSLHVRFTSDN